MSESTQIETIRTNERTVSSFRARNPRTASEGCELCGSTTIEIDEVVAPQRLALHECGRCHHRWTRALRPSRPRAALRKTKPALPAEVAIAS